MILRRLLTTASLSAVSAIMSRGVIFLGVLCFAYKLGPENYGHFSLIQATALLFTTFCALSLGQMATKIVAEAVEVDPASASGAWSVSYGSALLLSLPLILAVALSGDWLAVYVGGTAELALPYATSSLLVLSGFLGSVQNGVFLAIQKTKSQAKANICVAPFAFGVIVLAAIQRDLFLAVVGYAAAQIAFICAQECVLMRYRKRSGVRLSLRQTTWKDWTILWRLGIPSSVAGLFVVVATWLSMVMLSRSPDGVIAVGEFSLGNQARMILLFGVGVVANAALPMLASARIGGQHEKTKAIVRQSIVLLVLATAGAASVIAAIAFVLIPEWLPAYPKSIVPLGWLLASVVVMAPTAVFMRKATSDQRPRVLLIGNAVYSSVLLISAVISTRQAAGASGLAFAYFIAATAQLVIYSISSKEQGIKGAQQC